MTAPQGTMQPYDRSNGQSVPIYGPHKMRNSRGLPIVTVTTTSGVYPAWVAAQVRDNQFFAQNAKKSPGSNGHE